MTDTMTENDLIAEALKAMNFSDVAREGANWLNEELPETYQVSHGTVHNWLKGTEPMEQTVRALQVFYKKNDLRHQLGASIAALRIQKMEAALREFVAKGMP